MDGEPRSDQTAVEDGRYRRLVEAIFDYAIYMLDAQGVVTSWNAGALRFKGYEAHEIIGQRFSRFYTQEDRDAGAPAQALSIAASEGRFECEGWRMRKDGARFWAHVVIDPIRDEHGRLIGFANITRDLTEHREAEQALRHSEEQFRRLVQSVTDYAIFMLDCDGRVTNWNAGAQRIKGYRAEEIIGEHFSRFYTEEDRAAGVPAAGLATARAEGRWEQEGVRVRKDGERFWAHVIIDPIRDEAGEVIGFAKVTRDITERRASQKALDEAREALFQSQKMEAIGQFTGGVAHDFNNLLMAVLSSLELIRKRLPYDPAISPLIDNAVQGAERGAALTRRMLAFARKQELDLAAVDPSLLIRGLVDLLQRSTGPSIHIRLRLPPGLPCAYTDPGQLETALLNLVVNARDATPAGGVIVIAARQETVASWESGLKPGDYVRISVEDEGVGMDAATLARAAEPFFTTKGVGKGTGLGLSMAHGLAAQSGGALTIDSRPGEGARVALWLPVAAGLAAESAAEFTGQAELRHSPAPPPLRILLVDDDGLVLRNTAALLEDLGHHVAQASSGREALELVDGLADLDLVITDQVMPLMTGLQLREALRQTRPDLPILIASGYAEMPPGGPIVTRLSKPFSQQNLGRAVAEVMAAGGHDHPARTRAS